MWKLWFFDTVSGVKAILKSNLTLLPQHFRYVLFSIESKSRKYFVKYKKIDKLLLHKVFTLILSSLETVSLVEADLITIESNNNCRQLGSKKSKDRKILMVKSQLCLFWWECFDCCFIMRPILFQSSIFSSRNSYHWSIKRQKIL